MARVRPAVVSGAFYPADARELRAKVREYLTAAEDKWGGKTPGPVPKAIIAPHAGYVYSGPIAGTVYARLLSSRGSISRVILIGPSHRVSFVGLALTGDDAYETPLGIVPIDTATVDRLKGLPRVQVLDAAHTHEHSLEVHLPFLQEILGTFELVPIVVGDTSPEMVATVIGAVWGGPETVVVVSSDLSHYLDYDACRHADTATTEAIEALDPSGIGHDKACGRIPIGGLLIAAKRLGLRVTTLDVRNSGDTAGSRDRVVGYGAWGFTLPENRGRSPLPHPPETGEERSFLERHGETLLRLATASIRHALATGRPLELPPDAVPPALRQPGAAFVTLKRNGQLRGCIGSPQAWRPMAEDVLDNAFKAAFADPRFSPLKASEVDGLELSVSVLSPPEPMRFDSEKDLLRQIRPGVDGLIFSDLGRRGLFLPQVWEVLPVPTLFLAQLKQKAGFATDYWSPTVKVERFTARLIHDTDIGDPKALWDGDAPPG
ncbi:MAG: AmmeMemoRadiSam system protein B [Alphaproteobacteria bacterium]